MDSIITAIVELLQSRGDYRTLAMPLKLGDMTFRFDAALIGPDGYGDIVLLMTIPEYSHAIMRRRIAAFVTLLDRLHATRSVTLVLIIRGSIPTNVYDLEEFCRLLLVTPESRLDSVLLPLLRLVLPNPDKEVEPAEDVLARELEGLDSDPFVREMVDAAQRNADDVRSVLARALTTAADRHDHAGEG